MPHRLAALAESDLGAVVRRAAGQAKALLKCQAVAPDS
jgi:hypothetical protein